MLSAENQVLVASSLKNPMTSEAALYMLLKDQLPDDYDFNGAIAKLDLTPVECSQLSTTLSVRGLPSVVEELEQRLGFTFAEKRAEIQDLNEIENRVSAPVTQWKASRPEYKSTPRNKKMLLSFLDNPEDFGYFADSDGIIRYTRDGSTPSSKLAKAEAHLAELQRKRLKATHPQFVAAQSEVNRLRSEALISQANGSQEITVKNIETAYYALMAAGKLEEETAKPARPYLVGQTDPAKDVGIDRQIRKSPSQMSASEFIRATEDSKSFREKVNKPSVPSSSRVPTLTDETKRELLAEINKMPSHLYNAWLQDPNNAEVVNELYAQ